MTQAKKANKYLLKRLMVFLVHSETVIVAQDIFLDASVSSNFSSRGKKQSIFQAL